VRVLLSRFWQSFTRFDADGDLDTVAQGVAGCPRAVQHALLVIKRRADAIAHGDAVTPISCADLVTLIYRSWLECVFLPGLAEHLRAAEEAYLCIRYPAEWNATADTVDGIPVAIIPTSTVKQSWREAAQVGVIAPPRSGWWRNYGIPSVPVFRALYPRPRSASCDASEPERFSNRHRQGLSRLRHCQIMPHWHYASASAGACCIMQ